MESQAFQDEVLEGSWPMVQGSSYIQSTRMTVLVAGGWAGWSEAALRRSPVSRARGPVVERAAPQNWPLPGGARRQHPHGSGKLICNASG